MRIWLIRIGVGIALCALTVVVAIPLIGLYLSPHVKKLAQSDAIVVISGGGLERLEKGIALYHDAIAPLLIVSGAAQSGDYSNAQAMKRIAMDQYDIPESAIITDDESMNTYENALDVQAIIKERNIQYITLFTSEYHQRRAFRTFRYVMGDTVIIQNAPADVDFWHPYYWWQNEKARYLTITECIKIVWSIITDHYA